MKCRILFSALSLVAVIAMSATSANAGLFDKSCSAPACCEKAAPAPCAPAACCAPAPKACAPAACQASCGCEKASCEKSGWVPGQYINGVFAHCFAIASPESSCRICSAPQACLPACDPCKKDSGCQKSGWAPGLHLRNFVACCGAKWTDAPAPASACGCSAPKACAPAAACSSGCDVAPLPAKKAHIAPPPAPKAKD